MAELAGLYSGDFDPRIMGKVVQLVRVLDGIAHDSFLSPRVCLHGGTALNLFELGLPRLSVDIDLNYVGSADLAVTEAERPKVEESLIEIGRELGFEVAPGRSEHSGRSFRLNYSGRFGRDHVKVDMDYLNRSPLLPVASKSVRLAEGTEVSFPVNSAIELVAGKMKALLERVAVRDLYDIGGLEELANQLLSGSAAELNRRVLLFYLSKSAPFPRPIEMRSRFVSHSRDVEEQLYPVLSAGDRPTLEELINRAERVLKTLTVPHDEVEAEYLQLASRADYRPALLFADYPDVAEAAEADPALKWKRINLGRIKNADE